MGARLRVQNEQAKKLRLENQIFGFSFSGILFGLGLDYVESIMIVSRIEHLLEFGYSITRGLRDPTRTAAVNGRYAHERSP